MSTYITKKFDYNVICDVCGWQMKAHQLQKRWDGKMVCKEDWEPRHPSDFYRTRQDAHRLPFTRPDVSPVTTAYDVDVAGFAIDCKKSQNATCASPVAGNIVAAPPLTIEAMVLIPPTAIAATNNIYRYGNGGYIFRFEATDALAMYFYNGANATGYRMITNNNFIPSGARGRWARVSFAMTSTAVAAAYFSYRNSAGTQVNTAQAAIVPSVQPGLAHTGGLIIGNTTALTEPAPGPIDDIRIWSTARTGTQCQDNWEKVLPSTTTGLVSNWRFDDLTTNPPATVTTDSILAQSATLNGAGSFPHMMVQGT